MSVPVRRAPRGFTLLEVLVVLLVIGLASALLYPRLDPSPARALQRDAERLSTALESAARLAQWRGATLGVSLEATGYHVWERDEANSRWVIASDEATAPGAFDPRTRLSSVRIGGMPAVPGTMIVLRPSGRNEPVLVELTSEGATAHLRTDFMNRVAWSLATGG